MTDKTATARTARRNAQIAAVKKIIGGDANTMLIAAVFGEQYSDAPTARLKLADVLDEMKRNVLDATDADCKKIASVMREHPRAEKRRGKRKIKGQTK